MLVSLSISRSVQKSRFQQVNKHIIRMVAVCDWLPLSPFFYFRLPNKLKADHLYDFFCGVGLVVVGGLCTMSYSFWRDGS